MELHKCLWSVSFSPSRFPNLDVPRLTIATYFSPYDCGVHKCDLSCHPHMSSNPLPCPRSPTTLTTCPCGSTPLSVLLPSPRASCSDPIPLCGERCPKLLNCGHTCGMTCHEGDCASCGVELSIVCRCGSSKSSRRCGARSNDGSPLPEFLCERICRAMRNCARHECGSKCCPLSYQEALKVQKGRRRPIADMFDQMENDPLGVHQCERTCGRKLACGNHTCQASDHKGPCPPCLMAGFDELICHCGYEEYLFSHEKY